MSNTEKAFDSLDFIMAVEQDGVDEETLVEGVQEMINSGLVWELQGSWQRLAQRLITNGFCTYAKKEA